MTSTNSNDSVSQQKPNESIDHPDYHSDEWIRNALAKCHSEHIPWLSKELKLTLKGTIE